MSRSLELWPLIGLVLLTPSTLFAADYYVATTGDDSNAGTLAEPFATLQRAHTAVSAGDNVYIRGGTYEIVGVGASTAAGIELSKSGASDANRIKYWAYPGEIPVFDFARMTVSTTGYTVGFSVTGSFLHIKGLEIKNVPMNTRSNTGMSSSGSNNIFELMNFHHNNGTGLFLREGTGGNLILNCDSHDNYDPTSSQGAGQNADGFGVHYQETGSPTIIRGCRAWWNSDDGYDYISQEVPVITENSWAMGSGYINSGTERGSNGNGFKIGSSKTGIRHVVRNCLAWGNAASGFYANHSTGGNDWFNNTAYDNGTQYNMLASIFHDDGTREDGVILTGDRVHRMRNNIGFPNDNTNMQGVDESFNSWNLNIVPAEDDFVSVMEAGFMGPRQPDGSLPNLDFMKVRAGSQLIDKGTDVGLPYADSAPDLGCYETGLESTGAGGAGGSSGASGNGGAGVVGGASGDAGASAGIGGGALGGAAGASGAAGIGGSGVAGSMAGGAGSSGSGAGAVSSGGAGATGLGGSSGTNPSAGQSGSSGTGAVAGASGVPPEGSTTDGGEATPSGCSCKTAGGGNGMSGALAALLFAAHFVRRRRA